MERPVEVSLVAGVAAVFGFTYLVLGLVALSGPLSADDAATYGLNDATTQVAILVVGLALLVFTVGAWMEQMRSRFLGVGISVVGIAAYLFRLFNGGANSGSLLAIVVFAIILAYLVMPEARRAFDLRKPGARNPASCPRRGAV